MVRVAIEYTRLGPDEVGVDTIFVNGLKRALDNRFEEPVSTCAGNGRRELRGAGPDRPGGRGRVSVFVGGATENSQAG